MDGWTTLSLESLLQLKTGLFCLVKLYWGSKYLEEALRFKVPTSDSFITAGNLFTEFDTYQSHPP